MVVLLNRTLRIIGGVDELVHNRIPFLSPTVWVGVKLYRQMKSIFTEGVPLDVF